MIKRCLIILMTILFAGMLCACGGSNNDNMDSTQKDVKTINYTDDTGRKLELPVQINRIAATGPASQIFLFALCPDRLVGISSEWTDDAKEYISEEYRNLPVLGHLYGGKSEMNLETLLSSGVQVVIDIGEAKDNMAEELDALTEQTGIPFIHIEASLADYGQTFRKLGELLNMEEEAEVLASYCDNTYQQVRALSEKVEKKKVLYITGTEGLNVIAKGSYHAEVLDMLTENLAVVDQPSSKGTGNEVDMEQILAWNPEYIIFATDSIYGTVGEDPLWKQLTAIKEGHYYEVPDVPCNWMGFPPSVQRELGMIWLSELLYPEEAEYDVKKETEEFYQMFYHWELAEDQLQKLNLLQSTRSTRA